MKKIIRNFALALTIVAMPALLFSCKSNEPDSGSSSSQSKDTTTVNYYVYAYSIPSVSFSDTKYESGLTEAQQTEEYNKMVTYSRSFFNGLKELSSNVVVVETTEAMPDSVLQAKTPNTVLNYMDAFAETTATTVPFSFLAVSSSVDITTNAVRTSLKTYLSENYPEYTASESSNTLYLVDTYIKVMDYQVKMVDGSVVETYLVSNITDSGTTLTVKPTTSTAE